MLASGALFTTLRHVDKRCVADVACTSGAARNWENEDNEGDKAVIHDKAPEHGGIA